MKLIQSHRTSAFTLGEMLIAVSISSFMLAATFIASISLQKSLNAVDNFFTAHVQQVRIVDYLSRDAKRAYIVSATSSPQTVTCAVPDYINGSGVRRTPTITVTANGITVDYRAVADGVTTNGSAAFTSATAGFTSADVGKALIGTGIPTGTAIQSYTSSTTVTMSANATASAASVQVTIGANVLYSINSQSILRTENSVLTTIASSTDNLLPSWLDVELSNTEYLTTSITFLPIFATGISSSQQTTERNSTTFYSTAYLRNKRRG